MKSLVFVRIDKYKEFSESMRQIKLKLEDAKQVLKKIKELKGQEDSELRNWQHEMMLVEQKLDQISQAMVER